MLGKYVFATIFGIGLGGVVGFLAGYAFAKRQEEIEEEIVEEEEKPDEEIIVADIKKENSTRDPKVDTDYNKYTEAVKAYSGDDEEETEEDRELQDAYDVIAEEDYRDAEMQDYIDSHQGVIEMIKSYQYHTLDGHREVDYPRQEFWYFQRSDELADENNVVIDDVEKYVGDVFDKINFRSSDDLEVYIRNNPLCLDMWIHKVTDSNREEFY